MGSVYTPLYLADLRAIPRNLRARIASIIRAIEADPQPDGVSRRNAPPPFKPGTIVAVVDGFAIRYTIDVQGLQFFRVQIVR
jgi:hypothetical protein